MAFSGWAGPELKNLKNLVSKFGVDEVVRVSRELGLTVSQRQSTKKRSSFRKKDVERVGIDFQKDETPEKKKTVAVSSNRSQSDVIRAQSADNVFLIGDTIRIEGTAKASFNGLIGQVTDFFNVEKQRWPVTIVDFNGKEKVKNVKAENLQQIQRNGSGGFEEGNKVQLCGFKNDLERNGLVGHIFGKFRKNWPVYIKYRISKHGVVEADGEETLKLNSANLRLLSSDEWHPSANAFGSYSGLQACALTKDNFILALEKTENSLHMWDTNTGEYERKMAFLSKFQPFDCLLTSDNSCLAILGNWLVVTDLESNNTICTIKMPSGERGLFQCMDISKDKSYIVTGISGSSQDYELKVFDYETGVVFQAFQGIQMPVKCVKICSNNNYVISAHQDEIIYGSKPTIIQLRKTSLETGEIVNNIAHEHEVNFILISPDNQDIIVGDSSPFIKIFDFETFTLSHTIRTKNSAIMCGCMTENSSHIITGGKGKNRSAPYSLDIHSIDGAQIFSLTFKNKRHHDFIDKIGISSDQRYVYYLRGSHCHVKFLNVERIVASSTTI